MTSMRGPPRELVRLSPSCWKLSGSPTSVVACSVVGFSFLFVAIRVLAVQLSLKPLTPYAAAPAALFAITAMVFGLSAVQDWRRLRTSMVFDIGKRRLIVTRRPIDFAFFQVGSHSVTKKLFEDIGSIQLLEHLDYDGGVEVNCVLLEGPRIHFFASENAKKSLATASEIAALVGVAVTRAEAHADRRPRPRDQSP